MHGSQDTEKTATPAMRSVPDGFFIHVLFDGDLGKRTPVIAAMASNAPLLDPLFLHVGLAAFGTYKDALFIQHPTFFFHCSLKSM